MNSNDQTNQDTNPQLSLVAAGVIKRESVYLGHDSPRTLDLTDICRPRCLALEVYGEGMKGAGIMPGDFVIVDPEREEVDGDIVIARAEGQTMIRRIEIRPNRVRLCPAHDQMWPIEPREIVVLGVVTGVVRKTVQ